MKVYISRDENSDCVWVWFGQPSPVKLKECDYINWTRNDQMQSETSCYLIEDFKKKFSLDIKKGEMRKIDIPKKILYSQDYQMFSKDPDRKK